MILNNDLLSVEIPEMAACKGQVHFSLHGSAPADIALLGMCANLTAAVLFEKFQAQGTNLIAHVGKDTAADVLARYENDGVDVLWQPKQMDEQQLLQTQERIKAKTFLLQHKESEPKPAVVPVQPRHSEAEEDMMVRQLHRVP